MGEGDAAPPLKRRKSRNQQSLLMTETVPEGVTVLRNQIGTVEEAGDRQRPDEIRLLPDRADGYDGFSRAAGRGCRAGDAGTQSA